MAAEQKAKAPRVHRLGTFELKDGDQDAKTVMKQSVARDEMLSLGLIIAVQTFVVVFAAAANFTFATEIDAAKYAYFRDVNIMIFFGFGFLMTFLHRHGLSAIGYCFIVCCVVAELSLVVEYLFNNGSEKLKHGKYEVEIDYLMDSLFCGGAVMISYGAVIGKVTPFQLLLMAVIETFAFWINLRIVFTEIGAHDVGGGMVIHTFGAYFGLAATWWVTKPKAIENAEEKSIYSSDMFSLAGTIFLWVLWPSFQSAVSGVESRQMLAITNTFISLCSSCIAFAAISRLLNRHKFDVVHMQNATLAGGVVMGVAGDMDMGIHGPMICGFLGGALSCVGYSKVMPFLVKFNIHDTCGVNNLHGMPGIFGAIVGIIVTAIHNGEEGNPPTKGFAGVGAGDQVAALLVTLAISISAGFATGALITGPLAAINVKVPDTEYYNDRLFFGVSSDYADSAIENDVKDAAASAAEAVVCSV